MSDLIERLRGRYPIGPIQEDGEPEFAYRQFTGLPPIHAEAADLIESQAARIKKLESELSMFCDEPKPADSSQLSTENGQAEKMDRSQPTLEQVWLYNQGYQTGHRDTVEGMFTDIHPDDENEYHSDVVAELLSDRDDSRQEKDDE